MLKFEDGKADRLITHFLMFYVGIILGCLVLVLDHRSWVALIWSVGAILMAGCLYKVISMIKNRKVK
jgi:hypothetical protein